MLPDSISSNPVLLPEDHPSFFKGFLQQQDEALPITGVSGNHINVERAGPYFQQHSGDSNLQCKSVFVPHQLAPGQHEPIALQAKDPTWILGLFLLGLILVVMVKTSFPRRLGQILNAFISPRNLNVLIKEGNILNKRITPPLVFIQLISYSLFFYQLILMTSATPDYMARDYLLYLAVFGAVSAFYLFRMLMIRVIGLIFATQEQSKTYMINSLVINEVWGLALLPLCIIIFYAAPSTSWYLLIGITVLFVLLLFYMLVRNFMIGLSVTKFSLVYLFLYLCTVEILPLVIMGKLATDKLLISTY